MQPEKVADVGDKEEGSKVEDKVVEPKDKEGSKVEDKDVEPEDKEEGSKVEDKESEPKDKEDNTFTEATKPGKYLLKYTTL